MGQGCQFPFTATEYVKMDEGFPFTIRAQTNIPEGYNTTFCVKCSTASDSITQDDIVFTQNPSTPWMVIGIVVLVVGIIVCSALSAFITYSRGKNAGIAMAGGVSAPARKVDNELVDVTPQAKANADEVVDVAPQVKEADPDYVAEMKRDDNVDKDSDAPESIRSASFFQAQAGTETARPLEGNATQGN